MTRTDPPPGSFEDADRQRLLDGLRTTIAQRVAWFEEATRLVHEVSKRRRSRQVTRAQGTGSTDGQR